MIKSVWFGFATRIFKAVLLGVGLIGGSAAIALFFDWLSKSVYMPFAELVVIVGVGVSMPLLLCSALVGMWREAKEESERGL